MKTTFILTGLAIISFTACQSNKHKEIAKETIEAHDLIMPQLSYFDKSTIEIDSIIANLNTIKISNPNLDTTNTRADLTVLKADLENATDNMMVWMKDYSMDSTDVAYQQAELEKINAMKKQFEDVSAITATKLNPFK